MKPLSINKTQQQLINAIGVNTEQDGLPYLSSNSDVNFGVYGNCQEGIKEAKYGRTR